MINNNDLKLNKFNSLGAIHIHSKFSDGTGDVIDIAKAAKLAGLDWIIITDHNNFDVKEGFYDGVLVIKGEEISPNDDNHYLALGIEKYIEPSFNAQENVEAVRLAGGFGFAAHPDEGVNSKWQSRKNQWRAITWLDKNVHPDGIEIWNWFSQWGDNLNDKNIFTLAYAYLFKNKLITKPSLKTIKWWDDLNNNSEKIIPAIGGVDAHAIKPSQYLIPITVFPYKTMFETITNVITLKEPLTNDFETQKSQVLQAIKNGNLMVLNRQVSKDIPIINIKNATNIATLGEAIKLEKNTILKVQLQNKSVIKIFHNGIKIKKEISKNVEFPLKETGKYRVEIEQKNKGFAYSNPIIVY